MLYEDGGRAWFGSGCGCSWCWGQEQTRAPQAAVLGRDFALCTRYPFPLPACDCRVPLVTCHMSRVTCFCATCRLQVRSARRAAVALAVAHQQQDDNAHHQHQHHQHHQQQQKEPQVLLLPGHSAKVPEAVALDLANATTHTPAPSPETSRAAAPEIDSAPGGAAVTAAGSAGVDITATTDPGVAAEEALLKRTCVAYVVASGVQLPDAAATAAALPAGSKLPLTCTYQKRSTHFGIAGFLDGLSRCFRPARAAAFTFEAGPSTPSAAVQGAATANGWPLSSVAMVATDSGGGGGGGAGGGGGQRGMDALGATRTALPRSHGSPPHGSVSACSMESNSHGSGSSGIENAAGSDSSAGGSSDRECSTSHRDAAQLPLPDWNNGIVIFGLRKVYGGRGVVRSAMAMVGAWSSTMVQGAWRRLRYGVGYAWGRCRRGGVNTQARGRGQEQQGADGSGSSGTSPVHDSLFLSGTPELAAPSTTGGLAGSLGTVSSPAAATATARVQVTPGVSSTSTSSSSGAAGTARGIGGDGEGGEGSSTAPAQSRAQPRKARGAPHVAVYGTWLRIGTGECFCLLGECTGVR